MNINLKDRFFSVNFIVFSVFVLVPIILLSLVYVVDFLPRWAVTISVPVTLVALFLMLFYVTFITIFLELLQIFIPAIELYQGAAIGNGPTFVGWLVYFSLAMLIQILVNVVLRYHQNIIVFVSFITTYEKMKMYVKISVKVFLCAIVVLFIFGVTGLREGILVDIIAQITGISLFIGLILGFILLFGYLRNKIKNK